jgi:septal ring factor EnvC (AmiA/AmiB activator)
MRAPSGIGSPGSRLRSRARVTQQRNDLQAQLARATDDLSARNREVAELEGRLQTTRQELADAQGRLAGVRQQLATPPASESTSGAGAPPSLPPPRLQLRSRR